MTPARAEMLAQCESLLREEGYKIEHLDLDADAARAKDVFQIRAVPAPAS